MSKAHTQTMNVSIWQYIFRLESQPEEKLTHTQKIHRAFWREELKKGPQ